MTTPLPQIVCEGCGACCRHVGSPPGLYPTYASPVHDGHLLTDSNDWDYWRAMPDPVRRELTEYFRGVLDGRVLERSRAGLPCLWLDQQAGRCRHYQFRPEACRESVVPGDESCLAFRAAESSKHVVAAYREG
jgi:Fe-S-cluster containining protein